MFHISYIIHILFTYGYFGVFIIVFLESGVLFALPGDSLLFTAGLLAPGLKLNIALLITFIFIATFFGGVVGYFIGTYIERLHRFSFFKKAIKEEHINTTHKFFEKYGRVAILFSRFVPIIRTFTPIVAGIAKMNQRVFVTYSLISSLLWSTTITLAGYYLGRIFPHLKDYLSPILLLVVIVSVLPIVIKFLKEQDSN